MGLRIVLVGVVAGLGLTLPSGKQLESWRESARGWVSDQIAARDAGIPADENAFVIVPEPTPTPTPTETLAEAPPLAPEAVVTEMIETAAPEPLDPGATVSRLADVAPGPDVPTESMPLDESEPAPALRISDADFDAAQGDIVAGFSADLAATLAAQEAEAAEVALVEPIEVCDDDPSEGVAYVPSCKAEGFEAPVARSAPAESCDDPDRALAFALNREAEGLDLAPDAGATPEPPQEATPPDRDGRLTTAVRLTREAVYAWANLLHGPAVVTIGH
jgi:hypothetical protein